MHTVLGMDIGGTATIIAPADETGFLEEPTSILTEDITSSDDPVDHLADIIEEYGYNFESIGIGAAGVVDHDALQIEQSENWEGISFRELARQLEMSEYQIVLENDTDASLLGTKKFGPETEGNTMLYMNYGTGLGGSIWTEDSGLIRGMEPGFWPVNHELKLQHGGVENPIEAFCSGTGIEEKFVKQKVQNLDSEYQTTLSEDSLTPESFFESVRDHDEIAVELYTEIKDLNTQMLGGLVNNFDLDTIVFDGSVASNNSFLIDYEYGEKEESKQDPAISEDKYAVEKIFLENYMLDIRQVPELRLSELGDYSVLYGALSSALQTIETEI